MAARAAARSTRPRAVTPEIEPLVHERTRLGIMSALAASDTMTFTDLRALLRTTDGNLSVHARRLEEARYITCRKFFEGRVPRTEYRLTAQGRSAFDRYLKHMESLIKMARAKA